MKQKNMNIPFQLIFLPKEQSVALARRPVAYCRDAKSLGRAASSQSRRPTRTTRKTFPCERK
jgi:hypothetical protein